MLPAIVSSAYCSCGLPSGATRPLNSGLVPLVPRLLPGEKRACKLSARLPDDSAGLKTEVAGNCDAETC
jgi:hypothetical protein